MWICLQFDRSNPQMHTAPTIHLWSIYSVDLLLRLPPSKCCKSSKAAMLRFACNELFTFLFRLISSLALFGSLSRCDVFSALRCNLSTWWPTTRATRQKHNMLIEKSFEIQFDSSAYSIWCKWFMVASRKLSKSNHANFAHHIFRNAPEECFSRAFRISCVFKNALPIYHLFYHMKRIWATICVIV